jgi:16S rRNA (uracil1498-N3)-methyltransferase
MRRFFVEQIEADADGLCIISGSEARHILKVLRMAKGDRFILMTGTGDRYDAVVEGIEGSSVRVRLVSPLKAPTLPDLQITLCQAVIKPSPMDYLIEKTSELGVTHIRPFVCERTVIKLSDESASNKLRRWREIAISAAKQSDRNAPADILQPTTFAEILKDLKTTDCLKVILWEKEDSKDLKEALRASDPGIQFLGIVGPEGGFSTEEIKSAIDAGCIPVSLGKRILRAETAAITLTAIVQYEWGDLSIRSNH